MRNDPRDFPDEAKEWNQCKKCKYWFTGIKYRMFCNLCNPKEIIEDQIK